MSDVDPATARRAMDLRWPADSEAMARNSIRDEDYVASHLRLAGSGVTHDELLVDLYRALACG